MSERRVGRPPLYVGCKAEGCDNKHYIKGYCKKHDARLRRHGDLILRRATGTAKKGEV